MATSATSCSARSRGRVNYGGSFENRTRFAREIIEGIKAACPGLTIGVRLSAFDLQPFKPDPARGGAGKLGPGIPEEMKDLLPYRFGFGCNPDNPLEMDLTEPIAFIQMLGQLGVRMINASCAFAVLQPAHSAPGDVSAQRRVSAAGGSAGGRCPADRCGASTESRLPRIQSSSVRATRTCRSISRTSRRRCVREGWVDSIGLGRLLLSYWDLPADTLAGQRAAASSGSAARSATARPRRGTGSSADAFRSIRITRTRRSTRCSKRARPSCARS